MVGRGHLFGLWLTHWVKEFQKRNVERVQQNNILHNLFAQLICQGQASAAVVFDFVSQERRRDDDTNRQWSV